MFDGKTLNGWKANENPDSWQVKEGTIVGDGEKSHLFWMEQQCRNCEFQADVKISDGGNSGMLFRAAWGPGFLRVMKHRSIAPTKIRCGPAVFTIL